MGVSSSMGSGRCCVSVLGPDSRPPCGTLLMGRSVEGPANPSSTSCRTPRGCTVDAEPVPLEDSEEDVCMDVCMDDWVVEFMVEPFCWMNLQPQRS